MFQKAIQHSLGSGLRSPRNPLKPASFLCRTPLRTFAVKIEVESDSASKPPNRPKYKPVFVIDFKNGRFQVFRNGHRKFYAALGLLTLVASYSAYQLFWKWAQNGKLKNFMSVWGFLIGLAAGAALVINARANVKSIHLLKGGTQIELRPVLGWKRQVVDIRDIETPSEMEQQLMDMMGMVFFEANGRQFDVNIANPQNYEMADRDLFMAIVRGSEVDTGLSGEHPTITL